MRQWIKQLNGWLPLWLWIVLAGVAIVTLIIVALPQPQPVPPAETQKTPVPVVTANSGVHQLTVRSQGTIAPRREIDVVAEVSGRIVKVSTAFVNGRFFTEDELLVQIDPRDYEYAAALAESELAAAQAELSSEKGRHRQAKREWRDLGNVQANALFLREPQLAAARARVIAAKAALNKAKLDIERTHIRVPFAGRIRQTHVNIGQYVSAGTPIARVYDTEVAEVRLPLTDHQVALLDLPLGFNASNEQPGPEVTLSAVVAGKSQQWQGRITRTDASIDTQSRFYYAVAEIVDPFLRKKASTKNADATQAHDQLATQPLVVGLFVEAEISGRPLNDVVALPAGAVFHRNRLYYLNELNEIMATTVEVLQRGDEQVWIRAKDIDNTQVLTARQGYVAPGLVVVAEPQMAESQLAESQEDRTVAASASNSVDEVNTTAIHTEETQ